MVKLFDKLRGKSDASIDIAPLLQQMAKEKSVVPVEIEETHQRFQSGVILRSGSVLLGYPQALDSALKPEKWVRLTLPEDPARALRLQVASGQYNPAFSKAMGTEDMMLMCRLHGASVISNARRDTRYDATRYKDLTFRTESGDKPFKVVDLSRSGLQIAADPERVGQYPVGEDLPPANIILGNRTRVKLMESRVRRHVPGGIGLEVFVSPEGASMKIWETFLKWIQDEERKTLGSLAAQPS